MPINDDEYLAMLKSIPDVIASVDELFNNARHKSEPGFYLAMLDIKQIENKEMELFSIDGISSEINKQFANYFNAVSSLEPDIIRSHDENFVVRLQMLAYSQFGEFIAVKRLLLSLTRISNGEDYSTKILSNNPKTATLFTSMIKKSETSCPKISRLLSIIYKKQIRDAFAHGQIYFSNERVYFDNYNKAKPEDIYCLPLETWDELFKITGSFVRYLFWLRLDIRKEISLRLPYDFSLPGFKGQRTLYKNDRGMWCITSTNGGGST